VLLLDTHVWLWSVEGDARRVGRRARQAVSRAEAQEAIRVSPASLFELTALHTLGRVRLTRPPEQWIREALGAAGVRVAELSAAVAMDAGTIPRTALADPLDRLLVATAGSSAPHFSPAIRESSSTQRPGATCERKTPACRPAAQARAPHRHLSVWSAMAFCTSEMNSSR
jgi:PIN domain nuclease of toxin-antitoxin system